MKQRNDPPKKDLRPILIIMVTSLAMAIIPVSIFFKNSFDFLNPSRLLFSLVLAIPIATGIIIAYKRLFRQNTDKFGLKTTRELLLTSLVFSIGVLIIIPPPSLSTSQTHHLIIQPIGQKNSLSQGTEVEILKLRYANLISIPVEDLSVSGDWISDTGSFRSDGGSYSAITVTNKMPGGAIINFRYGRDAGIVKITWDALEKTIDLYAPEDKVIVPFECTARFGDLSLMNQITIIIYWLVYLIGIFSILLIGMVLITMIVAHHNAERIIYAIACGLILIIFIQLKLSYFDFSSPRVYNDTLSYVTTAEQSRLSSAFWFGLRPFTYPLFLSFFNINSGNFESPQVMQLVAVYQAWISIACWSIFAFTVAARARRLIIKPLIFGGILFFNLTPEISLWDQLILSESITLSCFLLLLSSWIWLFHIHSSGGKRWLRWLTLILASLAAILYVFTRDSNIYILLICCLTFLVVSLVVKQGKSLRKASLVYFIITVCIFGFHSISLSGGDRWQVFIYDQLSMRILREDKATQFFSDQGLPLSDTLLSTTSLAPAEYQPVFMHDPDLQPVRQWVACCGIQTYLKYVLSDIPATLSTPFIQYDKLINSNSLEYRAPRYGVLPVSERIADIASFLYYRQSWMLIVMAVLSVASLVYFLAKGSNALWLVISALIVSVYPAMLLIWYAEPMEIERHALQIGIQFRLAGLIVFLFLLQELVNILLEKISDNQETR